MVEFSERSFVLCLVFIVYLCRYESIAATNNNNIDRNKKQLEEIEEVNEAQREQELDKVYSSLKANTFLSYDKCIQRLKCPVHRKEECSEECQAGNTEEEMEEHEELTHDERRSSLNKVPKQKYEGININSKKQRSNNGKTSNTKTDL